MVVSTVRAQSSMVHTLGIGVSIALVVFAWAGLRINRLEGAALLAGYGAYFYWVWP